jgi:hypothetical protein
MQMIIDEALNVHDITGRVFVNPAWGLHKRSIHLFDREKGGQSYIWLAEGEDPWEQLNAGRE